MKDKLGRGWMQARGAFKGGLLSVCPATLWTLKSHIDAFYIAFGVTLWTFQEPQMLFLLQYHASFRVKPKINLRTFYATYWSLWSNKMVISYLISHSKVRCDKQMVIKVGSHVPCNLTKFKERSTRFWLSGKVAMFCPRVSHFPTNCPFFHDTDCVKKREGKGNIKLSFVWLFGEEKNEKVKKV